LRFSIEADNKVTRKEVRGSFLQITKLSHIAIIGPSLFFVFFTLAYLWMK